MGTLKYRLSGMVSRHNPSRVGNFSSNSSKDTTSIRGYLKPGIKVSLIESGIEA